MPSALSFLPLKRLSQKGTQPNATAFLALTIQTLIKLNCFDLYLLRQPLKGEGCRALAQAAPVRKLHKIASLFASPCVFSTVSIAASKKGCYASFQEQATSRAR